jgi:hypothetical protein
VTRGGLHAEQHNIPGLRIREDSMLDEGICVEKAPTAANRTPTATASFRVRIPVIWQEFIEATRGSREARHCAAGLRRLLRPREALAGKQVMELLTTTVVLVTHEPRVAAYADPEVIVRDGRVTSPVSVAQRYRSRCGSRSLVGGRRWPGSSRSSLLSQ